MMQTEFRRCQLTDLPALQAISRETFSATFGAENSPTDLAAYLATSYSTAQLTSELTDPDSQFYFIYQDGTLAAYLKVNQAAAQTEPQGDAGFEIERIYVRQQFKRQGLGRLMYQHACQLALAAGKQFIWLGVWENNGPAQAFYEKLGFHEFGQHTFTLGSDAQTDLLLRRDLTPTGAQTRASK